MLVAYGIVWCNELYIYNAFIPYAEVLARKAMVLISAMSKRVSRQLRGSCWLYAEGYVLRLCQLSLYVLLS